MKKTAILLLSLLLIVSMCGCKERSEEAKAVDDLIVSIDMQLMSEKESLEEVHKAIEKARTAYNNLSEEDRNAVKQYNYLENAESRYLEAASKIYKEAINWASVGSYDLAMPLFNLIPDYEDSTELYQRCEFAKQILSSDAYSQIRNLLKGENEFCHFSFLDNAVVYEYKADEKQLTGSKEQWENTGKSYSELSTAINDLFERTGMPEVDGIARLVGSQDGIVYLEYKNGKRIIFQTEVDVSTNNTIDTSPSHVEKYTIVSSSDSNFWDAVTAAQHVVRDELKSPSTAKFPVAADEYSVEKSGNTYKVISYVDAENSYGAKVRVRWVAFFTLDTSGSTYKITESYVDFDE